MVDVGRMQREAPGLMKFFGYAGGRFSARKNAAAGSSSSRSKPPPPCVVILDDDEDDEEDAQDEEEQGAEELSSSDEDVSYDADDEDCKILGTRHPQVTLLDCDDTGCEDDVRRVWEEAALRKKMEKSAAAAAAASSNRAAAAAGPSSDSRKQQKGGRDFSFSQWASTSETGYRDDGFSRMAKASRADRAAEQQQHKCSESTERELPSTWNVRRHSGKAPVAEANGHEELASNVLASKFHPKTEPDARTEQVAPDIFTEAQAAEPCKAEDSPSSSKQPAENRNGLIFRETLKESAEFQKANEEEWARRQQELEKQAQEVQRLRKRRRAENERRLEMERRQIQRLETIRANEIQESRNNGMKDQIRGHVLHELERKAADCPDLATLLRRLGVDVDGGLHCTTEQVNAAYKKALLRFHPDRAAARGTNDPRVQVEAEETFKLISKLKTTLQPVAAVTARSSRTGRR